MLRTPALVAAVASLLGAAALPGGAAPQAPPSPAVEETGEARAGILAWINEERRATGLEPLALDPRLSGVAQARAESLAAAGAVGDDASSIQRVSRALRAGGYEAHRWAERAILGYDDPLRMVRSWRAGGDASFAQTSLGPYEELGLGIAEAEDGALALALLFAVPRATEIARLSEPLRDLSEVRARVLERTNRARAEAARGLGPLVASPILDRAAQRYAERMLAEGFYAHVAPDGSTPAKRAEGEGYGPVRFMAENIAQGLYEPAEMVERWLGSRDHRANILHPRAAETGLGLAFGDTGDGFRVFWVQLFGRR